MEGCPKGVLPSLGSHTDGIWPPGIFLMFGLHLDHWFFMYLVCIFVCKFPIFGGAHYLYYQPMVASKWRWQHPGNRHLLRLLRPAHGHGCAQLSGGVTWGGEQKADPGSCKWSAWHTFFKDIYIYTLYNYNIYAYLFITSIYFIDLNYLFKTFQNYLLGFIYLGELCWADRDITTYETCTDMYMMISSVVVLPN